MKLQVEPIVEANPRDGAAWGTTPQGNAVLLLICRGQRVLVEMAPEEAREVGVGACYVATGLMMARSAAQGQTPPQALLVDPGGAPIAGQGKKPLQ